MRISTPALAALAVALAAGCGQTAGGPPPAAVAEAVEATATIAAIDLLKRTVVLKTEDGLLHTIVAGPEVRNLDRVDIGDTVKATYIRGVAARMAAPGQADETEVTSELLRAAKGDAPAAAFGQAVRTVVTIVAYDEGSNLVSFAGPDRLVRSVLVAKPEMRAFVRELNPGDKVEVTFTEAWAIGIVEVDGN